MKNLLSSVLKLFTGGNSNMVIILAVAVIVVAIAIEFYKKAIRGEKQADGTIKTKAKSWEVYLVAFALCVPWGFGLKALSGGNWILVVLWSFAVYAIQYVVDMALVKKVVNGLLSKIGGKV